MYYIVSFLVSGGAIFFLANSGQVPGIAISGGYTGALIFAVVLALINMFLGTLLRIITFPLKLLTLGLFSFVIYLIIIYITDRLVDTVTLTGWIPLVAIALVTTLVGFVMKIFK